MIIIRGLNKAFGDKIIFSNFNLEIPDGSFVVISGDSGSGKSTLLNMIGGIEKPDSGSIVIEGINVTQLKNKNSFFADTVGFLFQNFALLENKTVKENLSLIKKSSRTKAVSYTHLDVYKRQQMHSSYVITDPKGTVLLEVGSMLAKGSPMTDENGKIMRDKEGKVIYEPYKIKVLNTINFKKSMHYNPFVYILSLIHIWKAKWQNPKAQK